MSQTTDALARYKADQRQLQILDAGFAEPIREDCADLTEATIEVGHSLMLEQPAAVNAALDDWYATAGSKERRGD